MELYDFTLRVQEILETHFPDMAFEFDPDQGVIVSQGLRFSLGNMLAEYRAAGLEQTEFSRRIVLHFTQAFALVKDQALVFPSWEVAKPRLRLQLANLEIPDFVHAITFPFSKTVGSAVVIDAPNGYAYVQKRNAEMWEQTAVDLIEIARENLQAASNRTQMLQVPTEDGAALMVTHESDGYAAARVLLPSFRQMLIQSLAPDSDFVWVGVPNRDFLIAWPDHLDGTTKSAIQQQIALDAKNQHHPLCPVPLRVTAETIVPDE
jgi:uncharacterized protein YtpQ (UPF0354 family)